MKRAFQLVLLLAVAAMSAAPAVADGPVLFRYKFDPNSKLIYRKTSDVKAVRKVGDNTQEVVIKVDEITERRLLRIDGQKNFQLENENKRLVVSMKIGAEKYKFDSRADENEKGSMLGGILTPVYETLSGAIIKSTVTPRGEVLAVKGYAELLAPVLKDSPLAKQFVAGGTDKAARLQASEEFPVFSEKKVKPGDTWEVPFKLELPNFGTAEGKKSYKYEGDEKLKGRTVAKITFTMELAFKLDLKQGGQEITGELSITKSSGTVYFDAAKGQLVSLKGAYTMGGDLTVTVGEQDIEVRTDQTQKFTVELLDKIPEK